MIKKRHIIGSLFLTLGLIASALPFAINNSNVEIANAAAEAKPADTVFKITTDNVSTLNAGADGTPLPIGGDDCYLAKDTIYKTGDAKLTLKTTDGKAKLWTDGFRIDSGCNLTIMLDSETEVISKVEFSNNSKSREIAGFSGGPTSFVSNAPTKVASIKGGRLGTITVTYGLPNLDPIVSLAEEKATIYVGKTYKVGNVTLSNFGANPTYAWTIADKTVVDFNEAADAAVQNPTFKALKAGNTTATLTVTEGEKTATAKLAIETKEIGTIKTVAQAKAEALNTTNIAVKGEVVAFGYQKVYICDPDGTGIELYQTNNAQFDKKYGIGDIITVTSGKRGSYKGSQQISKPVVVEVEADAQHKIDATPKAIKVADLTSENYANYVTIKGTYKKFTKTSGNYPDYIMSFAVEGSDKLLDLRDVKSDEYVKETYRVESVMNVTAVSYFHTEYGASLNGNEKYYNVEILPTASGLSAKGQVWAANFLAKLEKECGTTYKLNKSVWDAQMTEYAKLADADKALFKAAKANDKGTAEEKVASLYDYVIGKYGFDNTMVRPLAGNTNNSIIEGTNNMIALIVIISILSVSAIALLAISKRRKATK